MTEQGGKAQREGSAESDRATGSAGNAGGQYPEPDFRVFLAGLYTQTLISLGELKHPVTQKSEQDLPEAQYLIDTISMLRQKTQGNLSDEEQTYLDHLLHDLRMRYVSAARPPAAQQTQQDS